MPKGNGNAGHNSMASGVPADHLSSFIARIEHLNEEKAALTNDIREVFAEAKASGFDAKIMREIMRERAMDAAKRQERAALLDAYRNALGMLADTPLGSAAMQEIADAAGI